MSSYQVELNKRNNKLFVILSLFWAVVIAVFTAPDSLDLFRYYEYVNNYSGSLLQLARDTFDRNYDFIYITSLGLCKQLGLPLDIATIIYVSLYYIITIKIVSTTIESYNVNKIDRKLIVCIILSVPFVWVICVSRSVAAFCFLYYSILCFIRNKRLKAVIFAILAILTHFSMIVFVAITLMGILITPIIKKLSVPKMAIIVVASIFLTGVVNIVFSDVINLLSMTFLADSRYGADDATYLNSELGFTENFFKGSMYLGERIHTAVLLLFYMFLLVRNKRRTFFDSVLLIGVMLLPFFLFSIPHMVLRTVIFLTPFFSVLLCQVYYQKSSMSLIQLLIAASILTEFWELYNARLLFF